MAGASLGYGPFDGIVGEALDLLPTPEFMPHFTGEEVATYTALGVDARKRFKAGEIDRAFLSYEAQIGICNVNAEPHVNQALILAAQGRKKEALASLRAAVVRGFTDLRRVERAEVWTEIGRPKEYIFLQDAIPYLQQLERKVVTWDTFKAYRTPESFEAEMARYGKRVAQLEHVAPILGERNARLWRGILAKESAAALDTYLTKRDDVPDLKATVDRLLELYAGGPLLRWDSVPYATAAKLDGVAALLLEKFPDSEMRPTALVGRAMARRFDRDRSGKLRKNAAESIRSRLEQVLRDHPESPLAATALVGLVTVDLDGGDRERARATFSAFVAERGADAGQMATVRENLGSTVLLLGGLPEISTTALTGEPVESASFDGKVVVIDFWATWCGPCVEGFPTLRRMAERHGDDLVMLGFNLDHAEEVSGDDLKDWIRQNLVPGRQIQDGLGWDSDWVEQFGVREIPFTVVVGADGEVLAVDEHGKKLEKTVRKAVERSRERELTALR